MKMGDSPSVGRLLYGNPEDPSEPSWSGQFVRAWTRPHKAFHRLTTEKDQIEEFGILELVFPLGPDTAEKPKARKLIGNQVLHGFVSTEGAVHFRFSPKAAGIFLHTIESNYTSLQGKSGALTALPTSIDATLHPYALWPNWWADNPVPDYVEGPHIGAKTVSHWREAFLNDFAERMMRCQSPAAPPTTAGAYSMKNWVVLFLFVAVVFASRADWSVKLYREAIHPPQLNVAPVLDLKAQPGTTVKLSAQGTTDPDEDKSRYRWRQYREAGTYDGTIEIKKAGKTAYFLHSAQKCRQGQNSSYYRRGDGQWHITFNEVSESG